MAYIIYLLIFSMVFLFLLSPLFLFLFFLAEFFENTPFVKIIKVVASIMFLFVYFFVFPLLTRNAARSMAYNYTSFFKSIFIALYELRVTLSFLPYIGKFIEPKLNRYQTKP